jgi:pantothenate kinase
MVIGMDGFHLTRAQLAAMPDPQAALARRGAPWTFDPQALARRLQQIRDLPCTHDVPGGHGAVSWPGFSHGVGDPQADAITMASSVRLVVLEGLYLLHREHGWDLSGLLHACAYLDVPLERAMERLTLRHMATRGINRAQASARIDANDRLNAAIVAASAQRADWRVADTPG